jgi:hypothetical protein
MSKPSIMASLPNNLIMRIIREGCAEETHKSKLKPCLSQIKQVYNSYVERHYGSTWSIHTQDDTEHEFTYCGGYEQYGEQWYNHGILAQQPNLPYGLNSTELDYGLVDGGRGPTEEQNLWLNRVFGTDWLMDYRLRDGVWLFCRE